MLICDTHADTLWARARRKTNLDVTIDRLADARHTRVQVLALFVETGGMQRTPTIVQQELAAFETMKAEGFRHIRTVEEAQSGRANVMLSIEGGEAFGGDAANVDRFAQLGVAIINLILFMPFVLVAVLTLKGVVSDVSTVLMMAITTGKLPAMDLAGAVIPLAAAFFGLYLTLLPVRRWLTARFVSSARVASDKVSAA